MNSLPVVFIVHVLNDDLKNIPLYVLHRDRGKIFGSLLLPDLDPFSEELALVGQLDLHYELDCVGGNDFYVLHCLKF